MGRRRAPSLAGGRDAPIRDRFSQEWPSPVASVFAVFCFGIAGQVGVLIPLASATLGLVVLTPRWAIDYTYWKGVGIVSLVGLSAVWLFDPSYRLFPHPADLHIQILMAIPLVVAALLLVHDLPTRVVTMALGIVIVITGIVGGAILMATADVGIDVAFLHRAAAEALANGESPYGEAVDVADGSPLAATGSRIIGYPYPPVTAVSYSLGQWILGDSRWIGLLAWLSSIIVLGLIAFRTRASAAAFLVPLLAMLPGWPLLLQAGWTEVLALAFVGAAAATWRRALPSAALLGLALATKQYFLVLAPMLLIHAATRGRRALVAIGVAAATVAPAFILDPGGAWQAIVVFHTNTPPRPDSSNLVGLAAHFGAEFDVPLLLVLVITLSLGIWQGRRTTSPAGLHAGMAIVLGGLFLLTSQTFANYWFLVAGLCALSCAMAAQPAETLHSAKEDVLTSGGAGGVQ